MECCCLRIVNHRKIYALPRVLNSSVFLKSWQIWLTSVHSSSLHSLNSISAADLPFSQTYPIPNLAVPLLSLGF